MNNFTLEELARVLGQGKEQRLKSGGFLTKCPCHRDEGVSLELRITNFGHLRFKCHKGCSTGKISHIFRMLGMHREPSIQNGTAQVFNHPAITENRPSSRKNCYRPIDHKDFIKMNFTKRTVYLSPFLTSGSMTLLFGGDGVGKSWVITNIAFWLIYHKVIENAPWKVINGGGILHVDGEMPGELLNLRYRDMDNNYSSLVQQHPYKILSSMEQARDNHDDAIKLENRTCRDKILKCLKENLAFKILILDNLSTLTDNFPERHPTLWAPINNWLMLLRNLGYAIILIHHETKNGVDRGGAFLRTTFDNIIRLERLSESADELYVQARFTKCRNLSKGQGREVCFTLSEDDNGAKHLVFE